MEKAAKIALLGEGSVEPNPMVGCLLIRDPQKAPAEAEPAAPIVASGFHQRFGGPHAEVVALSQLAGHRFFSDTTLYVTLEPCSHHGKTPPCADFLVEKGIHRVVVGCVDPNPLVAGRGIEKLISAGIKVTVLDDFEETQELIRPFSKLIRAKRPWIIAKWAMSMDGKTATCGGISQWISGPESRELVHQTRGRVDAILTGIGTVLADDPLLTARPADGVTVRRRAVRVICDSGCRLPADSKLAQTATDIPVLLSVGPVHDRTNRQRLEGLGVEILEWPFADPAQRLGALLDELGQRQMTNVLVESGGGVTGSLADLDEIDELHCYIAPVVLGGVHAPGPVGGIGRSKMDARIEFDFQPPRVLGRDVFLVGRKLNAGNRPCPAKSGNSD